jgi:hypothetical protein
LEQNFNKQSDSFTNMSRTAVVAYIPPPSFKGVNSFLENLSRNRPSGELYLYSDHTPHNFNMIAPPDMVVGKADNPRWAVNNAIFITGLRLAAMNGFTHMLYVETDCRFKGHGWDAMIFEEYFSLPFPAIAAGSLVSHSCTNGGMEFYRRFEQAIGENRRNREFPIPIYGIPSGHGEQPGVFPPPAGTVVSPGDPRRAYKPAFYPNGALGVYDVLWLCALFGLKHDGKWQEGRSLMDFTCKEAYAWDHEIGIRLYDHFGVDVFDVVAHMKTQYSGFGNILNTEAQRLQWLREGRCFAMHQCKSEISE